LQSAFQHTHFLAFVGSQGLAGNASLEKQSAVARDTSWLALCSDVGSESVCEFARAFNEMSFEGELCSLEVGI